MDPASSPHPLPFTHRDRLFEGIAAGLVGLLLVAAGVPFIITGFVTAGLVVALFGAAVVGAGVSAMRREVTLSAEGLLIAAPFSRTAIGLDEIGAIRVVQRPARSQAAQQHLRVRLARGKTVSLHAPTAQAAVALGAWLELTCRHLQARWAQRLADGDTVPIAKGLTLRGSVLSQGATQLDLSKPFELRETPGSGYAAPILSLRADGRTILLDANDENHPVIRRIILEHRARLPRA